MSVKCACEVCVWTNVREFTESLAPVHVARQVCACVVLFGAVARDPAHMNGATLRVSWPSRDNPTIIKHACTSVPLTGVHGVPIRAARPETTVSARKGRTQALLPLRPGLFAHR